MSLLKGIRQRRKSSSGKLLNSLLTGCDDEDLSLVMDFHFLHIVAMHYICIKVALLVHMDYMRYRCILIAFIFFTLPYTIRPVNNKILNQRRLACHHRHLTQS